MECKDKKLAVTMLDGFSMTYGGEEFPIEIFGNSKMLEIFQIILCYSKNGISRNQLIDMLYDDSVRDKNHSLDSVVYRLKKTFEKAEMAPIEHILIKNGLYKWNEESPLTVDVVEFVSAINEAAESEGEKKTEHLEKAYHIYKEEFLSGRPERSWMIELREKLHSLYKECIYELGIIYTEQKRYEELYEIYTKAVELYPYEKWQLGQLQALQYLGKFDSAYDLYVNTVDQYEEKLGLPLDEDTLKFVQQMGNYVLNDAAPIDVIKDQLEEKEDKVGAFYCSYPSFIDAYRYISRMIERSGQSVFLMICEYIYFNPMKQKSPKASELLKSSIGMSLRKGDSYTKYNNNQFLILLMGAKEEDCELIFNRIRKNFKKKNRNSNCDLTYFASTIQNTVEENETISFKNKKSRWNK